MQPGMLLSTSNYIVKPGDISHLADFCYFYAVHNSHKTLMKNTV